MPIRVGGRNRHLVAVDTHQQEVKHARARAWRCCAATGTSRAGTAVRRVRPADAIGIYGATPVRADRLDFRATRAGHIRDQAVRIGLDVALVDVRMPVKGNIDAIIAEQALQAARPLQKRVRRVVALIGVKRVVEEGKLQPARVRRKVGRQPVVLGFARSPVVCRIQAVIA